MATLRAFIAIDVPPSVRARLREAIDRLQRVVEPDTVRWARPEGIHLTLKFLGDVPVGSVDDIKSVLDEVVGRHTPFVVGTGGLGAFPSLRQPSVIWVGIHEASGALQKLQGDVESGAERLGFTREGRAFAPHLTLGRTRRGLLPVQIRRLGEALSKARVDSLGDIQADHLSLYSSELGPGGSVYRRLSISKMGP